MRAASFRAPRSCSASITTRPSSRSSTTGTRIFFTRAGRSCPASGASYAPPRRGVRGGDAARGFRVVAQNLRRVLAAALAETFEKVRHVVRVVAGGGHHARALRVGLKLSGAVELHEDHVRAVAREGVRERAELVAATAR